MSRISGSQQKVYSAADFFLEDIPRTLFSLTTNKILVEQGHEELLAYAEALIAGAGTFLPQRRVYANKDPLHLRRTVKLDPVAEFYLYHIVHKHRSKFRKPHRDRRQHYGYRFDKGSPISPSKSYSDFKNAIVHNILHHEEFISFDVASYFNNVYHHDLHAWFAALCADDTADVVAFGKFFREINAGRSLDCLPQGLYPSKMIGNDFLRFIEDSSEIRSNAIVRFMDDVYMFDDDLRSLTADFTNVQRLIGLKGLSINASKTQKGGTPQVEEAEEQISELKKRLLKRRRYLIISHYDETEEELDDDHIGDEALGDDEVDFIVDMLKSGTISEEDAELILIVMRDNVSRIEQHLDLFAFEFPHLAKNFYGLCKEAKDKEHIASLILEVVRRGIHIGEYQLFWFGKMLEDYLIDTKLAPDLIYALYKNEWATDISRAKVLEIADMRYGLQEMREAFLREGRSDWLAWASAVGSRRMDKQARNYLLDYFANGSSMNKLIAEILQKAPA